MEKPILVVTPNTGFGELICQVLDETGDFKLALATSGQYAMDTAREDDPVICIVEPGLQDYALDKLIDSLQLDHPKMKMVLIAPEETKNNLALIEQISVDKTLFKPFYLQDIVVTVEEIIKNAGTKMLENTKPNQTVDTEGDSEIAFVELDETSWFDNEQSATKQLASLSGESEAKVSLITKSDTIWASAGELGDLAVKEISALVVEYFAKDGGSDLARFVELESTGSNLMLYATTLKDDYMLALGFDAQMPFSKIRKQASQISRALISPPVIEESKILDSPNDSNNTLVSKIDDVQQNETYVFEIEETMPSIIIDDAMEESEQLPLTSIDVIESPNQGSIEVDVEEIELAEGHAHFVAVDEAEESEAIFAISETDDVLVEVEEEKVEKAKAKISRGELEADTNILDMEDEINVLVSSELEDSISNSDSKSNSEIGEQQEAFSSMLDDVPSPMEIEDTGETLNVTAKKSFLDELIDEVESVDPVPAAPVMVVEIDALEQTIPSKVVEEIIIKEKVVEEKPPLGKVVEDRPAYLLESISSSMYSLNYACTLLPKIPQTILSIEMKKYLLEWVSEVCLAFDWRVESLSIFPEYMQWLVNVTPDNSPEIIVNTIREYTSERLFAQFPRFHRLNPSGEFWAPGYLLIGDQQMTPQPIVHQFIANTRKRQGVGNVVKS